MRIEVLIGNEEPIIFPLKSSRVTLGRSEECDITIDTDGVSRKHLFILTEGDSYYVIDQGSTNGTFINEERLVPGKKVEFTSFFPIRLGQNVLVSLISEEEGGVFSQVEVPDTFREKTSPGQMIDDSRTRTMSLDELRGKTSKLIETRDKKRRKEPPPLPKSKKNSNFFPLLSLLIIVGAGLYTHYFKEAPPPPPEISQVGTIIPAPQVQPKVQKIVNTIPQDKLVPRENFDAFMNDMKCISDFEVELCQLFKLSSPYGVVQVKLNLNVLVDITPYYEEAKKYVKGPDPSGPPGMYEKTLEESAVYLFFLHGPEKLDVEKFKDSYIFIGFFQDKGNGPQLVNVAAFKATSYPEIKKHSVPEALPVIRVSGVNTFTPLKDFYTIY